tara:strand:+ start:107879 stop:108745 length:867 start_codon:yes stop_codon:yes gene_type:complete
MSQKINFVKMHGLGNDFVVLDRITQFFPINRSLIKKIGDRNLGIGCDQILIVDPPTHPEHDFNYRIFNANGKEVEQCGNGARCFGRYIYEKGLSEKNILTVGCLSGTIQIDISTPNHITANIGQPQSPVKNKDFKIHKLKEISAGRYRIAIQKTHKEVQLISLGNPHCVLSVPSLKETNVASIGRTLQNHPCFPQGINVSFVELLARNHIKVKVYERGAGETQACGSAAAASVIAGIQQKELNHSVQVDMPGGSLSVEWPDGNVGVSISGPTSSVFEGRFLLSQAAPM